MTSFVFLDTNLLLHYQFPDQVDWLRLVDAKYVTIVIAPIVVRELDKHKDTHPLKRLRKRAGACISRLNALLDLGNPATLREGADLLLLGQEPSISFPEHHLQPDIPDDRLIASILEHRRDFSDARIVLATADLGLKIKSRQHQIEVLSLPENLKLPEEPDPDQEQVKALQQELSRIKQHQPVLILKFAGEINRVVFQISQDVPISLEDIESQVTELKRKYPLRALPPPKTNIQSPYLGLPSLNHLAGAGPNLRDIQEYNAELEEFYDGYRRYLLEEQRYQTRPQRTLELGLMLQNTGSVPGEDIDLFLHFPEGFALYDEGSLPESPDAPDEPQTPESKRMSWLAPTFSIPPISFPKGIHPLVAPNISAPKIRHSNSYEVNWHVRSLKHGLSIRLDPLWVVFESSATAVSFTIDYRINAANLPQETVGKLHVIVKK